MASVEKILARHRRPAGLAGGGSSSALRRDLERHARTMATCYVALLALLVLILLGVGVMAAVQAQACHTLGANVLVPAVAAIAAILDITRRAVGEWSKAQLLVRVCRRVDGAQLDAMIDRLLG